uniref:Uncharacterized protein n=1 Tax=Trichogramma kaykai TaxID=54128 RepID=A0ABD2XEY2_9HYME
MYYSTAQNTTMRELSLYDNLHARGYYLHCAYLLVYVDDRSTDHCIMPIATIVYPNRMRSNGYFFTYKMFCYNPEMSITLKNTALFGFDDFVGAYNHCERDSASSDCTNQSGLQTASNRITNMCSCLFRNIFSLTLLLDHCHPLEWLLSFLPQISLSTSHSL